MNMIRTYICIVVSSENVTSLLPFVLLQVRSSKANGNKQVIQLGTMVIMISPYESSILSDVQT